MNSIAGSKKRILILGGGFGGAYAAHELKNRLHDDSYEVIVVDRNNYLLYYPLLVEASVGSIEARHVVVPIHKYLGKDARFYMADVREVDLVNQQVKYQTVGTSKEELLHYDELVFALGSVTRIPDVPGLAENGFQIKTLTDGVELRDRGIRLLELANTIEDKEARKDLLRVIVVGANYTGVEMAGEYEAFLKKASEYYPKVTKDEIEVFLLELGDRIITSLDDKLANYVIKKLGERNVKVMTKMTAKEIGTDYAILSDGTRLGTRTVIWAAGIAPSPLLKGSQFPLNEKGYIRCERDLRVEGFENVWAIGDAATVLDTKGKPYPATAQTSSRQGPHVAQNIIAKIQGQAIKPFDYSAIGSFAAFGDKKAAANVFGKDVTGFLGWVMYRGAYLAKFPTFSLKLRLFLDWVMDFFLPYPPVQLGIRHLEKLGEETKEPSEERVATGSLH